MLHELKNVCKIKGSCLVTKNEVAGLWLQFGFDPQYGARPLKRLIQKEIVNQLSKRILSGGVDKLHPVLVDVFDGVVVFRNDVVEVEKV